MAERDDRGAGDRMFAQSLTRVNDFDFGPETAAVFDDMLSRSVPLYHEVQRMTCELAVELARPDTCVVDIGCSTGTTLAALDRTLAPSIGFVGVDLSDAMLDRARERLGSTGSARRVELVQADLNEGLKIAGASVAVMVLTLQFVRPVHRPRLLRAVHDGLEPGGGLIVVEKVVSGDPSVNRMFIDLYHRMKHRHGYSELEIAQKREAIENVLVPYRNDENIALLRDAGFAIVETFFRWYNFSGVLALKGPERSRRQGRTEKRAAASRKRSREEEGSSAALAHRTKTTRDRGRE